MYFAGMLAHRLGTVVQVVANTHLLGREDARDQKVMKLMKDRFESLELGDGSGSAGTPNRPRNRLNPLQRKQRKACARSNTKTLNDYYEQRFIDLDDPHVRNSASRRPSNETTV